MINALLCFVGGKPARKKRLPYFVILNLTIQKRCLASRAVPAGSYST